MRAVGICATLLLASLFMACAQAADDGSLRIEARVRVSDRMGVRQRRIGLETIAGVVPLLAAGCALPCSTTDTFTTSADAQTQITIRLHRGRLVPEQRGRRSGNFGSKAACLDHRGTPQIALTVAAAGRDLALTARDVRSKVACRNVRVPVGKSGGVSTSRLSGPAWTPRGQPQPPAPAAQRPVVGPTEELVVAELIAEAYDSAGRAVFRPSKKRFRWFAPTAPSSPWRKSLH